VQPGQGRERESGDDAVDPPTAEEDPVEGEGDAERDRDLGIEEGRVVEDRRPDRRRPGDEGSLFVPGQPAGDVPDERRRARGEERQQHRAA
jgi:hypothetical protein